MTIERGVRKAEISQRLDRDTWADLDVVGYKFVAVGNGEAIAGPFHFGRAFDAPPIFSFSAALKGGSSATAPHITVGVSEWIIDEQDMYVGAYLWVKISDNCFDPPTLLTSEGVVLFEDFEDVLANQGGGPEGDEIPYMGVTRFDVSGGDDPDVFENYNSLYWPSKYSETFPDQIPFTSRTRGTRSAPFRWVQDMVDNIFRESADASLQQVWRVTDQVSRSGQYSLFCDDLIPPPDIIPLVQSTSSDLYPANILACKLRPERTSTSSVTQDDRYIWGWRCDAGTEVFISFYRMHDWVNNSLGSWAELHISLAFYGVNPGWEPEFTNQPGPGEFGSLGGGSWGFDLDPASNESQGIQANEWYYNELSEGFPNASRDTWIAPEGTEYVTINFNMFQYWLEPVFNITQLPQFKTWLDDIKIEFTGPQQPQRQPEFDVAIKFGGRTLKNYVGIHPLRSYEAPTKVVLS